MQEFSKSESFSLADTAPIIIEVLESGGEFELYPRGTSMLPLIRQGRDSVTLVKKPDGRIPDGEIAFYKRSDGHFVLHRIMYHDQSGYTMCGDNQTILEHGVTDDMIIATVSSLKINGKRVSSDDKKYRHYVSRRANMKYRRTVLFFRHLPSRIKGKLLSMRHRS